MSSANNTTLENFPVDNADSQPSVVFVLALAVLVVTGTLANGYVFAALLKKSRRTPSNITIVNLAIVDTLILLLVVPMCMVTLTLPDVPTSLCNVTGILGQILGTYSMHVQCLILYANVRVVTTISPNSKAAVGLLRLTIISLVCLAVDTFIVVYPRKYGSLWKLSTVGYCIISMSTELLWSKLVSIFYALHFTSILVLSTVFYVVLTRFVRKNSARSALARRRHVQIFKMAFRKLLLWVLAYSFISIARIIARRAGWPEVTFQVGYFLLWSNSVLNPVCYIFTSSLRGTIFPGWRVTSHQPNTGSTAPNVEQSSVTVSRRTNTATLVTGIQESQIITLPCQRAKDGKLLPIPFAGGFKNTTQLVSATAQELDSTNICTSPRRLVSVAPETAHPATGL